MDILEYIGQLLMMRRLLINMWQDWNARELQVPLLRYPREGQLCAQPHGPQLAASPASRGQETGSQVRRSTTGPVNPGQKTIQLLTSDAGNQGLKPGC